MGKKERHHSTPDGEASDNHATECVHFRKDLNQGKVKKLFGQHWSDACDDCKADAKTERQCEETDETSNIWLCLKCGHKGCGRNSEGQHALKHYNAPHSDTHSVILSLDNWSVWCYLCDDDVHYEVKDQLGQLVGFVQKKIVDKCSKAVLSPSDEKDKDEGKEDNATETEKEKLWGENNQQISVKGLSNLGNTCFFNAVIQILSQTCALKALIQGTKMNGNTAMVIAPNSANLEPLEIHTGQLGPLSSAMHQFLCDMQDPKKSVVTPKELFSQVCKKAVRFKGFQQQDSQELLHYLLDGMRTEELKRFGAGVLKALNYSSEKMEDEESTRNRKVYEKEASTLNFVDQVFGGELTNTIMCEECKMVTLVKESFLDLSLPILDDQGKKKSQGKHGKNTVADDLNENIGLCNGNFVSKFRDDTSTAPSKYEQKKAKKQAKKQAKHQRRQQKAQAKVLSMEDSTDKCSSDKVQRGEHDVSGESKEDLESNDIEAEVSPEPDTDDSLPTVHCLEPTAKETIADDGQELSQENFDVGDEEVNSGKTEQKKGHTDSHNSKDFDSSGTFESNRVTKDPGGKSSENETIVENMNKLNLNECTTNQDEITLDRVEFKNPSGTPNDRLSSIKDKQVLFLDPEKVFRTLTDRKLLNVQDGSIEACLRQFTQIENLTGANKLLCEECTQRQCKNGSKIKGNDENHVYTNAKKQMLISLFPPILALHLKRFQQLGLNLRKINKHIHFPQVLDLAPFCAVNCKNAEDSTNILYSLYGVVEQSGTMRSGHYTAYVKARTPRNHLSESVMRCEAPVINAEAPRGSWFHVSDTHVQAVLETKVLSAQAYILFYEKI
ncbi:ubiquitin carboxyl-terminal hydrolase 16 isoform X2 [Narcine bancroftii]|uniref:ubiquitin carboxyl-terminal hydrolase 16 isoform X2 n=1 Tax=Narcine bancroftii TaxID=1343680 RepID=UPI003831DF3D